MAGESGRRGKRAWRRAISAAAWFGVKPNPFAVIGLVATTQSS
jgi:hypothetical protein